MEFDHPRSFCAGVLITWGLYRHLQKAIRVPKGRAVRYFTQMAKALRYLHRKYVIHRDIKPEEILVGVQGEIKI